MTEEAFPVDYLLELAQAARTHPEYDPRSTEAHSPAGIAADAEKAVEAIQKHDWRAAANLHLGLAGALGDARTFFGIELDPLRILEGKTDVVNEIDRVDARQQWSDLSPTGITADTERVFASLADGTTLESWLPDAHDPVFTLIKWIEDKHGLNGVYDALACLLARPGDNPVSHGRSEPLDQGLR